MWQIGGVAVTLFDAALILDRKIVVITKALPKLFWVVFPQI
jgi:hypothetical protein